jgi:predicted ribosome quality control (RQC) complex YloA/Tae2 family protein
VVAGVSPLLAREITHRATGSIDTRISDVSRLSPLLDAFHELFNLLQAEQWQPTLAVDDDGSPVAFAPYPLTHFPATRPTATFSEAVEIYFADAAAGYAVAKAPLTEAIAAARQKLARRRERLEEDGAAAADPERFKRWGEVILAATWQIQPGQTELAVDWLPGEVIKLDPSLTASDNAQQYFSRYRKAQRAGDEIPAQLKKIALELAYLEQLEQDLAMADDRPEIDSIGASLAEAGYYRSKRGKKKQKQHAVSNYLRLTAPGGAAVWVGKNALQNQHLTFSRANADDLWLHARGVPGAHVIIPTAQGLPSEDDVFWAAGVAAFYSRARHDTAVDVDVTVKKHVRAIKGAPPGMVTLRNESTLHVSPIEPETD